MPFNRRIVEALPIVLYALILTLALTICWIVYDFNRMSGTGTALVASQLSAIYFVQKQRLDETKQFNELFRGYNERYRELHDQLAEICTQCDDSPDVVLGPHQRNVLDRYFDLCSEEFLFWRLGHIESAAWKTWLEGMKYYYKYQKIGEYWMRQCSGGDLYYHFNCKILESS